MAGSARRWRVRSRTTMADAATRRASARRVAASPGEKWCRKSVERTTSTLRSPKGSRNVSATTAVPRAASRACDVFRSRPKTRTLTPASPAAARRSRPTSPEPQPRSRTSSASSRPASAAKNGWRRRRTKARPPSLWCTHSMSARLASASPAGTPAPSRSSGSGRRRGTQKLIALASEGPAVAEDERGILRAESDPVAERELELGWARHVRDVVEVALRIGGLEVERRWKKAALHPEQRRGEPGRSRGALRVPDLALHAAAGNSGGRVAERLLRRTRLDAVIEQRGGAVVLHVADVLGTEAGVGDRLAHRPCRLLAGFVEAHAVVRVAGRAVAADLGEHPRAARARALERLEDEHPGALAEDEPVPPRIERAARRRRGAHAGRGDEPRRVGERIGRGRAAGRDHVRAALEAETHRDLRGERSHRAGRDRVDRG